MGLVENWCKLGNWNTLKHIKWLKRAVEGDDLATASGDLSIERGTLKLCLFCHHKVKKISPHISFILVKNYLCLLISVKLSLILCGVDMGKEFGSNSYLHIFYNLTFLSNIQVEVSWIIAVQLTPQFKTKVIFVFVLEYVVIKRKLKDFITLR